MRKTKQPPTIWRNCAALALGGLMLVLGALAACEKTIQPPETIQSPTQESQDFKLKELRQDQQTKKTATEGEEDKRPKIAIVIDDLGLNAERTQAVMQLPQPLTLAFLPYGPESAKLAATANLRGFEVILHMPMQPTGGQDPGPNAITPNLGTREIIRRLDAAMAHLDHPMGLNNHMGSAASADRRIMATVLAYARANNLYYLDSFTTPRSEAANFAEDMHFARRDIFLDNIRDVDAIKAQLKATEKLANEKGQAIAIGHPHTATIRALAEWLPQAAKTFNLVAVSQLTIQKPVHQEQTQKN